MTAQSVPGGAPPAAEDVLPEVFMVRDATGQRHLVRDGICRLCGMTWAAIQQHGFDGGEDGG